MQAIKTARPATNSRRSGGRIGSNARGASLPEVRLERTTTGARLARLSEPPPTTTVGGWWVRDGAADESFAPTWTLALPEGPARQNSLLTLTTRLAQEDPAAALDVVFEITDEADQQLATHDIALAWSRLDPQQAFARAADLPPIPLRTELLGNLVNYYAQIAPQEAIALADKLPAGQVPVSALASAVLSWSDIDPNAAAAWSGKLPPGDLRSEALSNVVSNWARLDPVEASKWLDTLPPDAARERAAAVFAGTAVARRPSDAARWAASVNQPELRRETIETVARAWLRTDRLAAVSWLRSIGARDLIPVPML